MVSIPTLRRTYIRRSVLSNMGLNCLQVTKIAASRVKMCFRGAPVHNVLVLEPRLESLLKFACTASSWTRGLHIALIYVPLLGI